MPHATECNHSIRRIRRTNEYQTHSSWQWTSEWISLPVLVMHNGNATSSDPWPWFGHQFLLHGLTALQQRLPCHPVQPCATAWDRSVLQRHTVSQTTFNLQYCALCVYANVSMFTLLPILTFACLVSSRETMSTPPSCAARWRGLMPCRVTVLHSAPYSSNVVPMSNLFFLAAMWRGV